MNCLVLWKDCLCCDMWKVCLVGVISMLLALVIKKEKPDYGQLIILAGATIIMGFAVERIIYVIDFVQEII